MKIQNIGLDNYKQKNNSYPNISTTTFSGVNKEARNIIKELTREMVAFDPTAAGRKKKNSIQLTDVVRNIFEKKTPLEKAAKYSKIADKKQNYSDAFKLYNKASQTLKNSWDKLDSNGHYQYYNACCASAKMAEMGSNPTKSLDTYIDLFTNLELRNSPLLKDKTTMEELASRLLCLGDSFAKKGDLLTAKNSYEYCNHIFANLGKNKLIPFDDTIFEYLSQKIAYLNLN